MIFFVIYDIITPCVVKDMKVKSISLGCKVNTYESEFILSTFKNKGYEIVDNDEKADIYIINTCSVTNTSDAKSRKMINHVIRENEKAIVVVMGCMIEANHDYDNPGVSIIIGNKDKNKVLDLVEEYLEKKEKIKRLYQDFDSNFEDMFITNMEGRTRAFVKIQDGCENFCSYCIIPYTRGKCRSKEKDKVLEEINTLVANGYKEVVLTGIHTGHYGENNKTSFPELLKEIVKIKNLERLRISSIEITELNDDFLEVLKNNSVIVSHLHIPLQSGSDKILKLMNRKYDKEYYRNKIKKIKEIRPDISITTDIIVGFPSESEDDFQETLAFSKEIGFSKIHVFPYSRRKGTKADVMSNQIDESVKKDRVKRLTELSNELERIYLDKFIGKEVLVLIERNYDDVSVGHTGNYLKVEVNGYHERNSLVKVKIIKLQDNYLIGSKIE